MAKSSRGPKSFQVDRYVRGLMSPEEAAEFMQSMQANSDLAYEVAEESALWSTLESIDPADRLERLTNDMPEVLSMLADQELSTARGQLPFLEAMRRADLADAARREQEIDRDEPMWGRPMYSGPEEERDRPMYGEPMYPEPDNDLEPEP